MWCLWGAPQFYFYPRPADSIGHYLGRSVCPKCFHFSNFSALGLNRELGFSRGPPSGTPDLNDDDDEINEDNKEEEDKDNNEKLFFPKLSSVIPFRNHKLGLI